MSNQKINISVAFRAPMPGATLELQSEQSVLPADDGRPHRTGSWQRLIPVSIPRVGS
jgi:hypothetical protein